MQQVYAADKMNVAALGNVVPQLHMHHVSRFKHDPASSCAILFNAANAALRFFDFLYSVTINLAAIGTGEYRNAEYSQQVVMMMDLTNTLGFLAGFLTTISFIPQVVKIWRTKSVHDISYGMFAIFSAGVGTWLVYGIIIGATPIIIANSITLVFSVTILGLKFHYEWLNR